MNITVNPSGQAKNMTIVKPMGAELDEKAVDAVSTFLFAPATRDGQPVAVVVYVESGFSLD